MRKRTILLIAVISPFFYFPTEAFAAKIMLFGGYNHATYLGCLNCSAYGADSVFNPYSQFGNQYNFNSIFNSYSQFGSPYSMYSACNPYATDPPVIVDDAGNFYGRLTINRYNSEAT